MTRCSLLFVPSVDFLKLRRTNQKIRRLIARRERETDNQEVRAMKRAIGETQREREAQRDYRWRILSEREKYTFIEKGTRKKRREREREREKMNNRSSRYSP